MQDAFAYCQQLVRETDRDRFLSALFAPEELRGGLFALYAFAGEIERVRDAAREAIAGEIRLQWWREAIAGERAGEAAANPVAVALLDTVARRNLPHVVLQDFIEAHSFDLYNDPMGSLTELEGYGVKTRGAVIELALSVLTEDGFAAQAREAGIAQTIAGMLLALPQHLSRGQIFLPLDLMTENGVRPEQLLAGQPGDGLSVVTKTLVADAMRRLTAAASLPTLSKAALPAFLPVALVRPLLIRLDKNGNPFDPPALLALWRQWLIWRAARNPRRIF